MSGKHLPRERNIFSNTKAHKKKQNEGEKKNVKFTC